MKEDVQDNWNTKNNAALRIALFFELTGIDFTKFEQEILKRSFLFLDVHKIRDVFVRSLFLCIDEFFSPFIVKEIIAQKEHLSGKNSKKRYASFFLTPECFWQEGALKISDTYTLSMKNMKDLILKEIKAYLFFIKAFEKDIGKIKSFFNLSDILVKDIHLNLSDRHNFQGTAIEITFKNGEKIMYKPRKSASDQVFDKIINMLDIPLQKKLNFPKILSFPKYHWAEYVRYHSYKKEQDLHLLYEKFGLLMGILDMCNYTDGHDENFIISKNKQFVIVDTETLFTNLSYFVSRAPNYFDLEFTGMIFPKNLKMHYTPVLQKKNRKLYYPYKPYILNDNSDKISIRYQQVLKHKINKALPFNTGKVNLDKFKEDLKKGLLLGYRLVIKEQKKIVSFLRKDKSMYRQIVRPTLYYLWLIYRYLHPCTQRPNVFLLKKMGQLPPEIINYEKKFISYANIPVFYHRLNERNLLGNKGEVLVKNYFQHTSLYWIQKKIKYLSCIKNQEQRSEELFQAIKRT